MTDLDDILDKDSIKNILDQAINEMEQMETLILAYNRKDGTFHWSAVCRRTEGLGMCDAIHHDLEFHNEDTIKEE